MHRTAALLVALVASVGGCAGEVTSQQSRPFAQAGVVEGFYGSPWSHGDRLDLLRFMGEVGLTHYYYAPKDDPYHRERWREPYPDDRWSELKQSVDTARAHGVTFVYAISPGGSMVYSDSGDYGSLLRKLAAVGNLGVRDFALFLDDVPPTLEHEADRGAYETLADAHADVVNRLQRDLAARGASLAVTPTTYTDAWGDREYLRSLGAQVVPEVPFFWTGIDVAAPEITALQAREWAALTGRAPLVWDNYPVNDFARWRPFLGPVRYRAANLSQEAPGILANPMNEAHASMIALATLAAYARDPAGYDPDSALPRSLLLLYGDGAPRLLAPFLAIWGDYPDDQNLFEPLFIPGAPIDVTAVAHGVAQLEAALSRLDSAAALRPALHELYDDLAPFVRRTAARLADLTSDTAYEMRDGRLTFRSELERYEATDGSLDDWSDAEWHELRPSGRTGGPAPRVAFRVEGEHLVLALQARVSPSRVRRGPRVGTGDHVALVLQSDTDVRRHVSAADLLLLVAPPTDGQPASAYLHSLPVEGFMAKYLADNGGFTFSEFLLSTMATPPTGWGAVIARGIRWEAHPTEDGYALKVAVPLEGSDRVRLSLTVAGTAGGRRTLHALARRVYPLNPATFGEVVVRR
jgi:hypothetical protein